MIKRATPKETTVKANFNVSIDPKLNRLFEAAIESTREKREENGKEIEIRDFKIE